MSDSTTVKLPTRAYQACVRCRRRKARCIVPEAASGSRTACLRCTRERKECVFTAERSRKRSAYSPQHPNQARIHIANAAESSHFGAADSHLNVEQPPCSQSSPTATPPRSETNRREAPSISSQLQTESPATELLDRVTHTVLYNQTDALNLLFEAAEAHHSNDGSARRIRSEIDGSDAYRSSMSEQQGGLLSASSTSQRVFQTFPVAQPSDAAVRAFGKLKFVRKRWLTAQEAITYVELFFKNLGPLSPATNNFYRHPSNYHLLVKQEPVLCTVILTLSTRYHVLDVEGWLSRSYFLHNRLWRYSQSLLQQVIWGQEKGIKSATRGLGTIEGLLLLVDWHARSLHMPPDIEAWDSDDDEAQDNESDRPSKIPSRWLEGVVEPMRRSGRMSWSLAQSAVSIGQELQVFDEDKDGSGSDSAGCPGTIEEFTIQRRRRIRILLYMYTNQLAFRIGLAPLIPQSLLSIPTNSFKKSTTDYDREWFQLMSLSVDLSRLMRTSSDLLFSSQSATQKLVSNGRYQQILEHFKPMLDSWWGKYEQILVEDPLKDLFLIDFLYAKIYLYSFSLQAVAEKIQNYQSIPGLPDVLLFAVPDVNAKDCEFIQYVIDSAKEVLRIIIGFAPMGRLKFLPVRVYIRVISTCIFLLKALALGVPLDELNASLDLIDQSARVLRLHSVDDVHLAGVFASLLETYTQGFRERFIIIPQVSRSDGSILGSSNSNPQAASLGVGFFSNLEESGRNHGEDAPMQPDTSLEIDQSWLAHPFDPSIAPFGVGFTQPICGFDNELNFVWNAGQ
ncbi:hypothetical protein BGW36DRAFT_369267 [Talaromyces proteolyticus]|uniref:Zn(2)-C6 fungal-type domain-containing protein n=1 Tax=Talaromyces proteolyticus TaxID=1131652 RepID=A0AAD4L4G3_9EURO|nr:uncharacterized protein BGW36DRAFT_369267 [Talaromyces proteolyticus]KAH8703392.1 hypothetical protein BGW36DRAFT_369267 [Talaromyces proteolyticus]